jgi:hypothetical protein
MVLYESSDNMYLYYSTRKITVYQPKTKEGQ